MHSEKIKEKFLSLFCCGMIQQDYITQKDYPEQTLQKLPLGTELIIVGFTKKDHPIFQFMHDFKNNLHVHDRLDDKTFHTFSKYSVSNMKFQKAYRVVPLGSTDVRELEEIPMFESQKGLSFYEKYLQDLNIATQPSGPKELRATIENGDSTYICTIIIEETAAGNAIGHYLCTKGGELHDKDPNIVIQKYLLARAELSKAL